MLRCSKADQHLANLLARLEALLSGNDEQPGKAAAKEMASHDGENFWNLLARHNITATDGITLTMSAQKWRVADDRSADILPANAAGTTALR
jgi:hypothetical protein